MNKNWKTDYKKYSPLYKGFQQEVFEFIKEFVSQNKKVVDISDVIQRPKNKIKTEKSIENNHGRSNYKEVKSIFDIKDVAGVRIICHCEDDAERLTQMLEGVLRQKYFNVNMKPIGGKGSLYPYKANHITFSKQIKTSAGKPMDIYCEVQLRTVMANAWAVQNQKYIYKNTVEGDAHELTNAVSEIMNGCEKLWSLVKKKSTKEVKEIKTGKQLEMLTDTKKKRTQINTTTFRTTNHGWFSSNQKEAFNGLNKLDIKAYMEVEVELLKSTKKFSKTDIRNAARESTIHTFGWPIAVYLENRNEYAPKPTKDGIKATISTSHDKLEGGKMFDYWAINENGSFYLLKSIFEDKRNMEIISFNTRIVRITEIFMYLKNLYSKLNIASDQDYKITITHGGIKGRNLSTLSQNRIMMGTYIASENEVETTIKTNIKDFENDPVGVVEMFTKPLFENFGFYELNRAVLEEVVQSYLNGKVT